MNFKRKLGKTFFELFFTNQKDDSFQPMVAKNKGKNEKDNSKNNGNTGNDMDKVLNFLRNWGVARVDV